MEQLIIYIHGIFQIPWVAALLDTWDGVSKLFGPVSAVFSALIWLKMRREERKANEDVKIVLVSEDGRVYTLPIPLLRKEVSRAEVLGRLGMMPMAERGKRFAIKYLSSPEFFSGLREVLKGESSALKIYCSVEEFDQFDIDVD